MGPIYDPTGLKSRSTPSVTYGRRGVRLRPGAGAVGTGGSALLGHRSPDMVRRYSATYGSAQAAARHAAFSPGSLS